MGKIKKVLEIREIREVFSNQTTILMDTIAKGRFSLGLIKTLIEILLEQMKSRSAKTKQVAREAMKNLINELLKSLMHDDPKVHEAANKTWKKFIALLIMLFRKLKWGHERRKEIIDMVLDQIIKLLKSKNKKANKAAEEAVGKLIKLLLEEHKNHKYDVEGILRWIILRLIYALEQKDKKDAVEEALDIILEQLIKAFINKKNRAESDAAFEILKFIIDNLLRGILSRHDKVITEMLLRLFENFKKALKNPKYPKALIVKLILYLIGQMLQEMKRAGKKHRLYILLLLRKFLEDLINLLMDDDREVHNAANKALKDIIKQFIKMFRSTKKPEK
ncbi:MAG: HEAT repeat protein [Candidatus Scalindua rubra]|uniref:HEAT repeat protein n=1 Tax=Candidatus Scalindua rubra TaxID=1872076 RepID=A0A1E3X399_9BACT|nr:MAG: HEAT repeat protein [Candidatus Scalindua rubra]